jgi:sulfhydrogenase subunit beta (sulfur reductase)
MGVSPKTGNAPLGSDRMTPQPRTVIEANELARLIELLSRAGYEVIAPTCRDGAIIYDQVASVEELPRGWTHEQQPGQYRLQHRSDEALFGYTVGPQSWKKYLHPSDVKLWSAERDNGTFRILNNAPLHQRQYAFVGVRACELAAIGILDHVLAGDKYQDPMYESRRKHAFIIAVQCTQSSATCFCSSMGTGPEARNGFDLALTELIGPEHHQFVVEVGSDRGAKLLGELKADSASEEILHEADAAIERARQQVRSIDTAGVKDLLYRNFESPRWDVVAGRCLSCANCTMVCPTCFCTTVEDTSDVTGDHAERWRRWDSCYTMNFSYIHGGSVRASSKSRYRQWMTHKLASWIDQFGGSGCVGCGRCITWCPVGIDITEEVRALQETSHGKS